jgi:hypothetical protein
MPEVPDQLSVERHRDLEGRKAHPLVRRGVIGVLGVIVIAALAGVFGQQPTTSRAGAPAATLEVQAPAKLRGGLIFQARFVVAARRRLEQPTLLLSRGWFESMSVNSMVPDATTQKTRDDRVELTFDPIEAGKTMTFWIYFQVNPTNVGHRDERVELADGGETLARIDRTITVFP